MVGADDVAAVGCCLRLDRLHRRSRLHLLPAGDDDAITVVEAAFDNPLVTARASELQRAHGDLVVGADDQRGRLSLRVVRHADLRHEEGVFAHALFDACAHEHAGKQRRTLIGNDRAHRHRAGPLVDGDVGELQGARRGVLRSVFQEQRDFRLIGTGQLQLAG